MSDHAPHPSPDSAAPEILAEVTRAYQSLRAEIHKVIVGQDEVVDQVLMAVVSNGHAVVVGGSGSPAATPQIALVETGFKGPIYHNHGTVNLPFIQTGKKAAEGAIAPTGGGALRSASEKPVPTENKVPSGRSHCSAPSLPLCLPVPGRCARTRASASWNVLTLRRVNERPIS